MSFFRIHERRRRCLIPLSALGLAAYYFLVFRPLGDRVAKLDQPLQQTGRELALVLGQKQITILDATAIQIQLQETRRSLAALRATSHQATERIELSDVVRARMIAPFQLVDYQFERQFEIDDLARLAGQKKVKLAPLVLTGFPEHTADERNPSLLWAKLEFIRQLLDSAIDNQATAIHSLGVSPSFPASFRPESAERLIVIPLRIELSGTMERLTQFVRSLPLTAEEIKAAGLPESSPTKPPFFIDHLLLRKHSPLNPDEVTLWLQVSGVVLRENLNQNLSL